MSMDEDARRTLFATVDGGRTFLVHRFDPPGERTSYEVSLHRNYLTSAPERLPLPQDFPEDFASEAEALDRIRQQWQVDAAEFQDVRLGRQVDIDFVQALKLGTVEPLRAGMSTEAVVALLGVPEAVMSAVEPGDVCWFLGSVQLLMRDGRLQSFEIDRGEGRFTSLRFTGWFLEPRISRSRLEEALTSHGVGYSEVSYLGGQVLWVAGARSHSGFLFDFYDEERLHALYWNLAPPV
ncbi:hypothetical protein OV208_07225 [Corallococcus sp. bb12-1]|uniref:hypothetical protein n=1 Tax=Corallococcus sp. bb12-1 TaxID=2996784 RepID=UPI00226D4D27|nr:hypothetical protein [Corallococcus sp. bb12-1]MCY1041106.1 hypothetical protein [Corallococcus sp. bb12-1]